VTVALFAPLAERDLRKLRRSPDLGRIREAIRALERGEEGLDIVALEGRRPWRRLREGDWRIIFRPLSQAEARRLGIADGDALLVARIVNRRDLERAIRTL
jgi:mRNA-degrading endonuclease RelE of RelBE toxin-antitoxin system